MNGNVSMNKNLKMYIFGLCLALISTFISMKPTFLSSDYLSNDEISKSDNFEIKISNNSSFILSHGILFTLDVKSNEHIEIKSFDIYTTSTDFMKIEIWTLVTSKVYKNTSDTDWISSCCHYPIRGKGKLKPTNIPISSPVEAHDEVTVSVFIKLNSKSLISIYPNSKSNIELYHSSNINHIPGWTVSDTENPLHFHSFHEIKRSNQIIFHGYINMSSHISNFRQVSSYSPQWISNDIQNKNMNKYERDLFLLEPEQFQSTNESEFFKLSNFCRYMQQVTSPKSEFTGSYGIMFDLIPSRNIIFETLQFRCKLDRGMAIHYTVYAKSSSYIGFEHNPEAWTQISQGSLLCAGPNHFTGIPKQDFTRLSFKAKKYYGMYITSNTTDILVGKNGESFFGNEHLHIVQGLSMEEYPPFGQTKLDQRIFQGIIHYSTEENCDNIPSQTKPIVSRIPTQSPTSSPSSCYIKQSIQTKLTGGSASFGIMFEIASKQQDIFIEQFQVKSLKERGTPIKYFIFTKTGSYHQFETNESAWIKIAENLTPSAGNSAFTTIPVPNNNPIFIQSSSIQSVYIIFNTPDLLYTKGTQEGQPYVDDGNIQILEGVAFVEFPPFGSSINRPRLFTGIINYSVSLGCSKSQTGITTPTISPIPIFPSSMHPSYIPTIHPSQFPTIAPSTEPQTLSSVQPTKLSMGPNMLPISFSKTNPTVLPSMNSINITQNTNELLYPSQSPTILSSTLQNISNRPSQSPNIQNFYLNQSIPSLHPTYDNFLNTSVVPPYVNISTNEQNNESSLCNNIYNFSTPVTGDSTTYGIMFDIHILNHELTLKMIGFRCKKTQGELVKYMVYFKPNSFQDFQTNIASWNLLAEGYAVSQGIHQYTTISLEQLESNPLNWKKTYSIYVTLDDPDIIYDNENKKKDFQNPHFQILKGVSVNFYPPFSSNDFSSYFFQGYLQYSIKETCSSLGSKSEAPFYSPIKYHSIIPTTNSSSPHTFSNHSSNDDGSHKKYPYDIYILSNGSFLIPNTNNVFDDESTQLQSTDILSIITNYTSSRFENEDEIKFFNSSIEKDTFIDTSVSFRFVKYNVEGEESNNRLIELHGLLSVSLQSFMKSDSLLTSYSKDAKLHLRKLQTNVSDIKEFNSFIDCLTQEQGKDCSMVESIMYARHNKSIRSAQLRYFLLSQTEKITEQILKLPRISYIGLKAEATDIYVTIKGKNLTSASIEDNMAAIQGLFQSHAQDIISKNTTLSQVKISELEIIFHEQSYRKEKKNEYRALETYDIEKPQRLRVHVSGSKVTIKFKIKSEYPSYLNVNVGDVIVNAIYDARSDILSDLQASAGINHISDIKVGRRIENTTKYHNESENENFEVERENITASKDENLHDEKGWNTKKTLYVSLIPISGLAGFIYFFFFRKQTKKKNEKKEVNKTASDRFNLRDDYSKSKGSQIWSRSDIEDIQNYKESMISFKKLSFYTK